jgi:hypothetical protein
MANLKLYEHPPYVKFARGENLAIKGKRFVNLFITTYKI